MSVTLDPSLLMNYYIAKLPLAASQAASSPLQQKQTVKPPWDISIPKPAQQTEDVAARNSDAYFNSKDPLLSASANGSTAANSQSQIAALLASTLSGNASSGSSSANAAVNADNDKLFALYSALNRLDYISQMATRDGTVDGQLPGLNKSFQDGLNQILSFVKKTPLANVNVLPGQTTSTAQSSVSIAYPQSDYTGGPVVGDKQVFTPVPGISASDSFTISVTKAGVKTDVPIDLSQVTGPLTIDNINAYANQQLAAGGFATRLSRVQTGGSLTDGSATWGETIAYRPGETVSLSSPQAKPAIYVAGVSGLSADSNGKLVKLTGLDGTPSSAFSANIAPDSGAATASNTAVDANGNVYVIGNSTGSFGDELNQSSQDVYLTKYDSAGNAQWTKLLGSAEAASGFGLAVDPKSGGVVIAGSVTGDLTPNAIGGGNDSFVAKYDSSGNQTWLRQVAPANNDSANSVSVDQSGNIYVGGQVNGAIASGQTSAGGTDGYVTKLDSAGKVVYQRQFGTAGKDAASQTAIASDGNLMVASVQNGHAILSKYASGDGSSAPMWQIDLGDLQGGTIGGLTVANGKVYLSGTTANAALNAGGAANVANANSGGTDGFVFAATDNGASASSDFVSYVGTGASDQGGGVAVAGGNIYLTGTTGGTFPGQVRNAAGTHNMFVAQLGADGTLNWTQQYGGRDGESKGLAIASDNSGSSVLDALKLQRGTIAVSNQSNAIEAQTTARPGDYFSLAIKDKTGTRTAKVTLEKGDTLRSLAIKINAALQSDGKAATSYVTGGQGLKISVNQGVQVQLVAGPKDFDALAGLGLKPQLLTNTAPAKTSSSNGKLTDNAAKPATTDTNATTGANGSAATPQVIGLGINGGLDLLSTDTAKHAHVALQGAMALIKQAYNTLNNPASATSATSTPANMPGYQATQLAGYQTALAYLQSFSTGTSS
ncbi:MAG TPA: SBBP repeat-containing protein [Micropepsaceae bacterium]|nr:SBBP repeat-containing protein [Micropepsaceae bacterium]